MRVTITGGGRRLHVDLYYACVQSRALFTGSSCGGRPESCAAGLQRHQPVASRDRAPKLGRGSQVRVPELQAFQPVHPPVRNPSNDPRWKVAALGRRLIEVGMKGAER